MKKMFRTLSLFAACAVCALGMAAFAACGGTGDDTVIDNTVIDDTVIDDTDTTVAKTLVGSYNSSTVTFYSAYPSYTYKQLTFSVESLNVYDDDSYDLIVTDKSASGELSFDASNTGDTDISGTNDRGCAITYYYGTCTTEEEEGLITIALSSPDRVVYTATATASGASATFYDTAAWTDDMTSAYGDSADAYLSATAFADTTVLVDGTTWGFDYIDVSGAGESKSASAGTSDGLVGSYNSSTMTFYSAYPSYTYKQLTFSVESLNVYEDGTYSMIVTDKTASGELSFDASNTGDTDISGTNDRGCAITYYYGTCTTEEEEGLITASLSAPTRVVYTATATASGASATFYDTDNWTDDMTSAYGDSADAYLSAMAFSATSVLIDGTTWGFDFLSLS